MSLNILYLCMNRYVRLVKVLKQLYKPMFTFTGVMDSRQRYLMMADY